MKPQNHENYHICPNCGHEYNFWDHGYYCPQCQTHNQPATARRAGLLFALCALLFALTTTAQHPTSSSQLPASFLITMKTGHTTTVFKNTSTATADSLLQSATGINTGISGFLKNSPFFEIRTRTIHFYCEAKPVKTRHKSARPNRPSNQQPVTSHE